MIDDPSPKRPYAPPKLRTITLDDDRGRPASNFRRSSRIPCEIPITLISLNPTDKFSQHCLVILANPQGCAIRVSRPIEVGAAVELQDLPITRSVTARVVNCISLAEYEKSWLLGLALDEPSNVWGIQNPPNDWGPATESDKRLSLVRRF